MSKTKKGAPRGESRWIGKGLALIERVGNLLPHPAILFGSLAMAVILGLLALFLLLRMLARPIAAAGERVEFVPVPKTTPSVYTLETDD